jgi:tRNA threonylcarbamoyl adenosine modification protein YjeE
MPTLWDKTAPLADLGEIARAVVAELGPRESFCLWLLGNLGAGKTTLTGEILRGFGLSAAVPVTSPTFTYINEYKIAGTWYAHLDLYRAGATFNLEDIGLVDSRPFKGYFVEWPDQVPQNPVLEPAHILGIGFAADGRERRYVLDSTT